MRKKILLLSILLLSLIICGCNISEQNKTEDKIKFSTFSQEERKKYISDFLKENYGVTCTVSKVKPKQISVVKNTDYYFATARTENEETISVWISKDGNITDSFFLVEMSTELSKHFLDKCTTVIPECKVKSYTETYTLPELKLSQNMDIEQYMKEEPMFTFIRIFVDDESYISEDTINALDTVFQGYDAEVYIYLCEDLENVDVYSYNYSTYEILRKIEKKE